MGKVADGQWAGDGVMKPARSGPVSSALGHLKRQGLLPTGPSPQKGQDPHRSLPPQRGSDRRYVMAHVSPWQQEKGNQR